MVTAIKKCFSPEIVNTGRQPELDIAKGLAIIFMIWTHVFEELSPDTEGAFVTLVRNILGGPLAAPVFMICLGIGISFSKKNTPKDLLYRGISLLKIGLLLNLVRYVLPDFIKYALTNDSAYLYDTFALFSVDILQFAGLAFLFLAAAKKLKLKYPALLLIGVATSLLGMSLRWIETDSYVINQFIGLLWGTKTATFFPFLNWIIFPISGMAFGLLMQHCRDKKGFYLYMTPLCAGLMIIYLILTIVYGFMFTSSGAYYFLGLFDAVFFIIFALMCFAVHYRLLQLFPKVQFKILMRWSKNTNNIFCIHWSIIGWLGIAKLIFGVPSDLPFWQVTLIAAVILIISDWLAVWYFKKLKLKLRLGGSK